VVESTTGLRLFSAEAPTSFRWKTKGFLKTKKKKREESDKTVPYDDQHLKTRHIEQGKFPHSFDRYCQFNSGLADWAA